MGLGHHEHLNQVLVKSLIPAVSSSGETLNTYNTAQGGASVDTWADGSSTTKFQWQKGIIVINAGTVGTSITCSLYDSDVALTNANGDAQAQKALELTAISEAGIYTAEFSFGHVFASTLARVTTDEDAVRIQRYLSLRAVTVGSCVFSADLILCGNLGGFTTQDNELTVTYVSA